MILLTDAPPPGVPAEQVARWLCWAVESSDHVYDEVDVTLRSHAEQTAELATASGASDSLVAASLLHDLGHLIGTDPSAPPPARDRRHEHIGSRLLRRWFGPAVWRPVEGHVDAKRWLCAAEPGYVATLSSGSRRSLALQGGPVQPAELSSWSERPFWDDTVALRRWDDAAKRAASALGSDAPPAAGSYRALLTSLAV